jgi:hypothetical protein
MEFNSGDYLVVVDLGDNRQDYDLELGEVVQVCRDHGGNVELLNKKPILWLASRFKKAPPPPYTKLQRAIYRIK